MHRRIRSKLKEKHVMLYDSECQAVIKQHIKMSVVETKMLRGICGNTLNARIYMKIYEDNLRKH